MNKQELAALIRKYNLSKMCHEEINQMLFLSYSANYSLLLQPMTKEERQENFIRTRYNNRELRRAQKSKKSGAKTWKRIKENEI